MGTPDAKGDDALVASSFRPRVPATADENGNPQFYGTDDNAAAYFPIDDRIVEFVQYGVLNGTFARGPIVDPDADIEEMNPLPDWTGPTQVSGGAITCQWVADSASPSGYNLRFTVNPGAASDEAYMEQIVPLGGSRARQLASALFANAYRVSATSNGFLLTLDYIFLDVSGNEVGSASTDDMSWIGDATNAFGKAALYQVGPASTDAHDARIRLRMRRSTAAASDSGMFDVTEVRTARAVPTIQLAEQTDPALYGYAELYQAGGTLNIVPAFGTSTDGLTITATGDVSTNGGTLATGGGTINTNTGILTTGGGTLAMAGGNITTDTSVGTKIGTAATQLLGFFGATPVAQPLGAAEATVTNAAAADTAPAGGTGTAAGGWDTAAHRNSAITAINDLLTTVADLVAAHNKLRNDLVALGLIKGSA